ncbi:transposase [Dyadobacter chenhuakuii]|uniref:Transposase n=1 Tax=Dyadobacter chenhuakuii TaxID=2909339 RepID=A0ABY4XLR6_9BACT|nr:transposase [Dyadobacter chenhuakuii]MCF2494265.1 transposase [Dyadobacter chenhuakuii]USJ31390.1 transposase [Dyadobacter chenhuakuii]
MKRNTFTETQIVKFLKDLDSGKQGNDGAQENGVSKASFYNWRKKYSGMGASELSELKALKEENRRLKHMYAELALDHRLAKDIIEKSSKACSEAANGIGYFSGSWI